MEKSPSLFHFSSYWQRWSRVLSSTHPNGPYVEVDLVPIPNSYDNSWATVENTIIRVHATESKESDIITCVLPSKVEAEMRANLDIFVVDFLLHEDILSLIDFDLYKENQNGGCPLSLCHKQTEMRKFLTEAMAALARSHANGFDNPEMAADLYNKLLHLSVAVSKTLGYKDGQFDREFVALIEGCADKT